MVFYKWRYFSLQVHYILLYSYSILVNGNIFPRKPFNDGLENFNFVLTGF